MIKVLIRLERRRVCYDFAEPMPRIRVTILILALAWLAGGSGASAARHGLQKRESRAELEKYDLHITGEVSRGQTYEQEIGHDLVFRLVPASSEYSAGWTIEVVPKTSPDDDTIEFSSIATPPYHAYNERDLAPVYGRAASDVVAMKDRTFFFVHSADDEHRAEEVVNAALYPTSLSDEERVHVAAERAQIQLGKGELRILKSHVNRGRSMNDVGGIDWLRFELNIQYSSGLTMANIISRVARQQ